MIIINFLKERDMHFDRKTLYFKEEKENIAAITGCGPILKNRKIEVTLIGITEQEFYDKLAAMGVVEETKLRKMATAPMYMMMSTKEKEKIIKIIDDRLKELEGYAQTSDSVIRLQEQRTWLILKKIDIMAM
jgi:hypothetical protein